MKKEQSLEIKGIALIMMLWCHFYISGSHYELSYLCEWSDFKLFKFLVGACSPVVFFVILSGYGLYCVYEKGDKHRYSRIFKLLCHYWVITLIFVTLAHFLANKDKYPGNFIDIILNITAFKTTWNHECWFLFPYSILALCYPFLFDFIKKHELLGIGLALFLYFFSGFLISRFGGGGSISNPFINNIVQVVFMLFPFLVGAISSKHKIFSKIKKKYSSRIAKNISFFFLLLLIIIKCFISSSVFTPVYGFLFICLYLLINTDGTNFILGFIGKHSMNIWMIHTWLMVYIFPDYFYVFKNPLLILFSVLFACIIISMIINKTINFIIHF